MNRQAAVQTQRSSKVTSVPTGTLQRQCTCGNHTAGGECEACKQKRDGILQRAATDAAHMGQVPPIVHDVLRSPGQPLDAATRGFFEPRFSYDFSGVQIHSKAATQVQGRMTIGERRDSFEQEAEAVADAIQRLPALRRLDTSMSLPVAPTRTYDLSQVRIHTDPRAAESARAVNALAYTVGHNIVFGTGQFAPGTRIGDRLLAHELTHVIQQGGDASHSTLQRAETDTSKNCAPLTDTKGDVNGKINKALDAARTKVGKPLDAEKVIDEVFNELGAETSVGRSAIEDWASALGPKKVDLPAQSATKYKGVSYGLWAQPLFPILNPTMKVNGICIGSDKLGHFVEIGYKYYLLARRNPKGTAAAAEEAGERSEGGGLGLATTGVFSNADLEANRQGLKFYDDLKAKPSLTFDIAKYISAKWNEETNPSFYEGSVAEQVWSNLLTRTWKGTFDTGGASKRPVTVNLNATTAGVVTGTYEYKDSAKKTVGGTIKNGKRSFATKTVKGESVTGPTTETPVSGVVIEFEWSEDASSGHGKWTSVGEAHLTGTWGKSGSASDRGSWDLT